MTLIIDRFEEGFAVCEDENDNMVNIARELIPKEAAEGDVLVKTDGGITIDTQLTKQRRQKAHEMLMNLFS